MRRFRIAIPKRSIGNLRLGNALGDAAGQRVSLDIQFAADG
jgi:hypothetical protein